MAIGRGQQRRPSNSANPILHIFRTRAIDLCIEAQKGAVVTELDEIRKRLQDRVIGAVSDATGLSRNTVAGIKSGKIRTASRSTVAALAKYLGVTDGE